MWCRFVLFGLFCLAALSYVASDKTQSFGPILSIFGEKHNDQVESSTTEISSERTTEKPQNQKEQSQGTTTKNPKEEETSKHSLKEELQQPSTESLKHQSGSVGTEITSMRTTKKEQSQESTTKKPEEKVTPQPVLKESQQPSTDSGITEKESLKDPDTKNESSKDRNSEKENSNKEKDEDEKVCFQNLGCFDMGQPWKSILRPIAAPNSPEEINTKVHFYNRQNSEQPIYITVYPEINIGNANFDPQKKSVILVHGFSSTGNATWVKDIKNAYLKEVDANFMVVDWGEGAQHANYLKVAGNTRVVGKELALLVMHLKDKYKADLKKFHLIGHSLGAQICSYLAKDVKGIARLTALDPAQPGFEGFDKEVRLDVTDADFVDVVHTDAKPFLPTLGFGMMTPQGHVDFYINGGYGQPGCILPEKQKTTITSIGDLAKYSVEVLSELISCSHGKAHEYFLESLNKTDDCVFWGHKADPKNVFKSVTNTLTQGLLKEVTALSATCSEDDCVPLGFDTDKSPLKGVFVITTNKDKPYCISEKQTGMFGKFINNMKENSMILGKIL